MNFTNVSTNVSLENFCSEFQYIGLLIFNNIVTIVFNSISVYLSTVLFKLIYKQYGLFHVNVRLMLYQFLISNGLTSIFIIVRQFYNFSLLIFGMDLLQLSRSNCLLFDFVYDVCNVVTVLSVSGIGFERFAATVSKKFTDPEYSNKIWKFISGSLWIAGIINNLVYYFSVIFEDDNKIMCYCFLGGATPYFILIFVLVFFITIQIFTFVSYAYVYYKNNQMSKSIANISIFSLQERYQIWNNISVTTSLLPNVISNAVLYTCVCSAYFFLWSLYWTGRVETAVHLLSTINDFISFGCFLQPLLLLKFNDKLWEAAVRENKLLRILQRLYCSIWTPNKVFVRKETRRAAKVISYQVTPDSNVEMMEKMWANYGRLKT